MGEKEKHHCERYVLIGCQGSGVQPKYMPLTGNKTGPFSPRADMPTTEQDQSGQRVSNFSKSPFPLPQHGAVPLLLLQRVSRIAQMRTVCAHIAFLLAFLSVPPFLSNSILVYPTQYGVTHAVLLLIETGGAYSEHTGKHH